MAAFVSLFRFKSLYLIVGVLYLLMAGGILLQGVSPAMAPFGVPPEILESPHYQDAIWWVYSHMFVLGGVLVLLGLLVREVPARLWLSRFFFVVHVYYSYLDFRSSDTVLGNGLYEGKASAVPAVVALFFTLVFLYLSLNRKAHS